MKKALVFIAVFAALPALAADTTEKVDPPIKDGTCHVYGLFADGRIELTAVQVKDGRIVQPIDFTVEDWMWCTVPWLPPRPRAAG